MTPTTDKADEEPELGESKRKDPQTIDNQTESDNAECMGEDPCPTGEMGSQENQELHVTFDTMPVEGYTGEQRSHGGNSEGELQVEIIFATPEQLRMLQHSDPTLKQV